MTGEELQAAIEALPVAGYLGVDAVIRRADVLALLDGDDDE